jgi:hypothetical protein
MYSIKDVAARHKCYLLSLADEVFVAVHESPFGRRDRAGPCPLSEVKRTLIGCTPMSAYDPKRILACNGDAALV